MIGEALQLENKWIEEWQGFINDLQSSNIRIQERLDELIWIHAPTGLYSPKFGYKWLLSQKGWGEPEWWFKPLWELKGLAKTKLLFWCILQNKFPS